MYLERMRHRDRCSHVYCHHCLTSRNGGRVIRKYVSRAALPSVRRMIAESKAAKKFVASLKPVFSNGSPGRLERYARCNAKCSSPPVTGSQAG